MRILLTLASLLVATQLLAADEPSVPPNIVVILVDDMGYGDPACFNAGSKIKTPHINALASAGMRFTDAHAPGPLCHMSRYGLLTGRYPFRTNVNLWRKQPLIEPQQMTIASLAKTQGYRTAMVGKWHLGFRESGYDQPLPGGPVDCGFDSFFGIRASTDIPPYFYIRNDRAVEPPTNQIEANRSEGWSPIQGAFWRAGGIAPDLKLDDVLPRFTNEAIDVIETHAAKSAKEDENKPLMLYLAYPAPHTPWLPSEPYVGKSAVGMYGDFVMMVDDQIGRVLSALRKANMHDNTLVVFTSDNGPVWYEADVARLKHDSAGTLRGMKADAWEAGHRMPFIVRWPDRVKPGGRSDQLVCFTDLLATFAEIMGVTLPADAGPDSFSFLPSLTGQPGAATNKRKQIVMQPGSRSMMTIRSGDWKLITGLGSGGFSKPNRVKPTADGPRGQLYNLADDLSETTNLYADHPEIVKRLQAELKQIVEQGRHRKQASAESAKTLRGKVMVGYQGWFNCPGDQADLGWKHWARRRQQPFAPGNVTVDLWPDMRELDTDEKYATGFQHRDGQPAYVFSSANGKTVGRHFQWMRDYAIDGAFVQRFASNLANPKARDNINQVLNHVRRAAAQSTRVYAVMYDLSGLQAGEVQRVSNDWQTLNQAEAVTGDATYLHHRGKPLVAVWGVGFNDQRKYSLDECLTLVRTLKDSGCSVMLGVPSFWREQRRDAVDSPTLHAILREADVISPWSVGRYRTPEEAARHATQVWQPDRQWCQAARIDFLPVVYPGFSWHNLNQGKLDQIPRRKGAFFWSQITAAKRIGSEMLYIAMFDEVDEATAIFKCTNAPPTGDQTSFLTYEGLPSDYYLHLAGEAGKVVRGELPISTALPTAPTKP